MLLLPFLNERRLGTIKKTRPFSCEWRPNLDFLLSRLSCSPEDAFVTHDQWYPAPPFSCKFRKDRELEILTVSNEEGDIYLIDTDRSQGVLKKFRAHNNAIFDICWFPDKNQLVTGGGDFYCFLFDMNTYKKISVFNYHTASVKSLDVCPQNTNLFAAGSKDGNISVWDTRDSNKNKPSIALNCAHVRIFNKGRNKRAETIKSSVSAVVFKDENTLASAGVADSNVKIWDLRKTYSIRKDRPNQPSHPPVYKIDFSHTNCETFGFTSLAYDSLYSKLYACSSTNIIVELDCHSYNKKNCNQYTGYSCSSYFVKMALSSDDQYLLCGSSDHKAYVWNVCKPGLPIYELPGHTAEVTSVAWSGYDSTKLATCGDDMKTFIWKTQNFEDGNCKAVKELAGLACPYSKSVDDLKRPGQLTIKSITSSVTLIEPSKPRLQKRNSSPSSIHSFFSPSATRLPAKDKSRHDDASPPQFKLPPNPLVLSPPEACKNDFYSSNTSKASPASIKNLSPTCHPTNSRHNDGTPPLFKLTTKPLFLSPPETCKSDVSSSNTSKASPASIQNLSPTRHPTNSCHDDATLSEFKSPLLGNERYLNAGNVITCTEVQIVNPCTTEYLRTPEYRRTNTSRSPQEPSSSPYNNCSDVSVISTTTLGTEINEVSNLSIPDLSSPVNNPHLITDNGRQDGELNVSSPRLPLSPCKNVPTKFSPPNACLPQKMNGAGKGNNAEKVNGAGKDNNADEVNEAGKENGGVKKESGSKKRKLNLSDRACKYHPDGCGRTRGGTRCGKKLVITPAKGNIKNYLIVTPKKP